jgi:hypothetical protein
VPILSFRALLDWLEQTGQLARVTRAVDPAHELIAAHHAQIHGAKRGHHDDAGDDVVDPELGVDQRRGDSGQRAGQNGDRRGKEQFTPLTSSAATTAPPSG